MAKDTVGLQRQTKDKGWFKWAQMGKQEALGLFTGTSVIGAILSGFTYYTHFVMPEWFIQMFTIVLIAVFGKAGLNAFVEIKKK